MREISNKVLNVGGGNKKFPLPSYYDGWEHILLVLDLSGNPVLHMDAIDMVELEPNQFDAIYCSNNLEHYYRADVKEVLKGMHHVLKENGFVEIMVPNIEELIKLAYERGLDIDDILYEIEGFGPITVHDFIFGYEFTNDPIRRELGLHKTAFTQKSLEAYLKKNGFSFVYARNEGLLIHMLGFKKKPGKLERDCLGLTL